MRHICKSFFADEHLACLASPHDSNCVLHISVSNNLSCRVSLNRVEIRKMTKHMPVSGIPGRKEKSNPI